MPHSIIHKQLKIVYLYEFLIAIWNIGHTIASLQYCSIVTVGRVICKTDIKGLAVKYILPR